MSLTYFIFGDRRFYIRIPAALSHCHRGGGIVWLQALPGGRTVSLLGAFFVTLRPLLLGKYGRYTRNEAFVGLLRAPPPAGGAGYRGSFGITHTLPLAAALSLHFCTKETAFIYSAQLLVFLGILFLRDPSHLEGWKKSHHRDLFFILTILVLVLIGVSLGLGAFEYKITGITSEETSRRRNPPLRQPASLFSISTA